ncbi:hypothetical protein B0H14DRAFT_3890220 [Mycena olivaceomarginata]|nr:hypothetical protein B0H14DRAFT_3890220 [Mycena olivaceomarginata]
MFILCGFISIVTLFLAGVKAISINDTFKGNDLIGQAFNPGPPSLTVASWMWTNSSGVTGVPPGSSSFRLTFHPAPVFPLANISVAISTDNAYNLYLNGTLVGSALDWTAPNVWTILNVPSNGPWIFSILATNYDDPVVLTPAGIIASFRASNDAQQAFYDWYTGQIAIPSVVWKANPAVPNNFASPTFDDSAWANAVIEAPEGPPLPLRHGPPAGAAHRSRPILEPLIIPDQPRYWSS